MVIYTKSTLTQDRKYHIICLRVMSGRRKMTLTIGGILNPFMENATCELGLKYWREFIFKARETKQGISMGREEHEG